MGCPKNRRAFQTNLPDHGIAHALRTAAAATTTAAASRTRVGAGPRRRVASTIVVVVVVVVVVHTPAAPASAAPTGAVAFAHFLPIVGPVVGVGTHRQPIDRYYAGAYASSTVVHHVHATTDDRPRLPLCCYRRLACCHGPDRFTPRAAPASSAAARAGPSRCFPASDVPARVTCGGGFRWSGAVGR